jgi:hypothetical protein
MQTTLEYPLRYLVSGLVLRVACRACFDFSSFTLMLPVRVEL